MNDFDQTTQPNLPGFEPYTETKHSILPDFNQVATSTTKIGPNGFDPHKLMVQKKQIESGEIPIDIKTGPKWPDKDVKALEDFCAKYGVLGFNCGKMSPIAALAMLKTKMGIVDGPLEQRVPPGYQPYSPSQPYSKTLLHG